MLRERRLAMEPERPHPLAVNADDFRLVDLTTEKFDVVERIHGHRRLFFQTRRETYGSMFLRFFTPTLLENVWTNNDWSYDAGARTIFSGQFHLAKLLQFLAIRVRVQGQQRCPPPNEHHPHAQTNALVACGKELSEMFPDRPCPPGSAIMTRLISRFLFSRDYFDEISANFQSVVLALVEFVSGDEKLDHFTGNSGHIRKVPNKPAKIGIWHYQLVGLMDTDKPYLLDASTSCPNTSLGESNCMADVVRIVKHLNRYTPRAQTTICFDAHYNNTRTILLQNEMKFSGAVKSGRLKALVNKVQHLVTKPGEFGSLYSPTTNELFTLCWDENQNLGKKMVLTNALHRFEGCRHPRFDVPGYSPHGIMFSGCDRFNQYLSGRMWPFKRGASAIEQRKMTLFSRPPC